MPNDVGLRSDCSIPLDVDEEVYMLTIALPRQLYHEDVTSRLKKHQLFQVVCLHLLDEYVMIMPELMNVELVLD